MKERPLGLICIALTILFWNFLAALGEERDEKERQTFVVRYKSGDQTIPVTVVLDYKKQTEYVINMNNRSPAKSVTLYDFKQRTIAYKDLTNRECFLGSLSHETLNEESEALQHVKNPVEVQAMKVLSLDTDRLAMTPTEIRNIAGQKTAVFCRKMTTWMLKPINQTHNMHKRDLEDEEEVEERSYGHHGFHTVRYSHYGHQTRRRYRRPIHGERKRKTQQFHPETSTFQPAQITSSRKPSANSGHNEDLTFDENLNPQTDSSRIYSKQFPLDFTENSYDNPSDENDIPHSYKTRQSHPYYRNDVRSVHYSPHDQLQNSGLHHDLNFEPSLKNQENRDPLSTRSIAPLNHLHELNQSAHDDSKNDLFYDASLNTTVSGHSGVVARTERETTPVDILPYHFAPDSNGSLGAKLLPLYRQEEDIKYDSSDFHGEIESNVLPLDYSQNYYPYHNSVPVLDLESHSSTNNKDILRKGFQNYDDLYSTDNPEFSNNVLEIPKITAKFESLHRQNPIEIASYGNQGSNHQSSYSNEIVNPDSNKLKPSNIETRQKEHQFSVTNDHFAPALSIDKNQFLNKDNTVTFSTKLDSLFVPATTETVFEEYTSDNFELLSNRNNNKDDRKFSSNNLGSYESHGSLKHRHIPVTVSNTVNLNSSVFNVNGKDRSRFQNEYAALDRTFVATNNHNTFSTTIQPFLTSTTPYDISFHHKARFNNVLKLFKPDEIIINVEKIPTQSPTDSAHKLNLKETFAHTNTRHSGVLITTLPFRAAPTETTQNPRAAEPLQITASTTSSPTLQLNQTHIMHPQHGGQASSSIRLSSHFRNAGVFGRRNHQKRKHIETRNFPYTSNKPLHERRNSSFQYAQSHRSTQRLAYPQPVGLVNQPLPFRTRSQQQSQLNALPPGVSMHPRHPQAPYADMIHSNVLHSLPDEQRYRQGKPHRQRHHRRKDRLSNSCCKGRGSCCSTSGSRTYQGASCCSSAKNFGNKQAVPAYSRRTPIRSNGFVDDSSRNYVDNRDRCQKEKMCRTLYESTKQVMVCRNAAVDGC